MEIAMKHAHRLFVAVLGSLATPLCCLATPVYIGTANIVVSSTSRSEVQAGYTSVGVPGVTLDANCKNSGSTGYLYIHPDDKEIFAEALTSQINGLPVSMYYDNNAAQVNVTSTLSKCKILFLSRQ
jgi:hypothetical protein